MPPYPGHRLSRKSITHHYSAEDRGVTGVMNSLQQQQRLCHCNSTDDFDDLRFRFTCYNKFHSWNWNPLRCFRGSNNIVAEFVVPRSLKKPEKIIPMPHPIPNIQFPTSNSQHPIPNIQFPTSNSQHPIPNIQFPTSNSQHPIPNIQFPTSNSQHPIPNIQFPTSNSQHPIPNIQFPTSNSQHPIPNIQFPTSNSQHPIPNIQFPTSNFLIIIIH